MMQLDRGNIANALTDTIVKDLGITTNDVNTRYQLLSMGVLIFEIPSNIVLQKADFLFAVADNRLDRGFGLRVKSLLGGWWLGCRCLSRESQLFC